MIFRKKRPPRQSLASSGHTEEFRRSLDGFTDALDTMIGAVEHLADLCDVRQERKALLAVARQGKRLRARIRKVYEFVR